jgi:hypothetical protein
VLDGAGLPPALIIANTHDPATPYSAGLALHERWGGSVLVTYEGDGHTAAFGDSSCVDGAVVAFLLDGDVPGELTCRPDRTVGVQVEPAGDAVVIVAVDPTGPAAGIVQPGDLLLAVNGEPFELASVVELIASGEPFVATIQRGGEVFEVEAAGQYPPYWRP